MSDHRRSYSLRERREILQAARDHTEMLLKDLELRLALLEGADEDSVAETQSSDSAG